MDEQHIITKPDFKTIIKFDSKNSRSTKRSKFLSDYFEPEQFSEEKFDLLTVCFNFTPESFSSSKKKKSKSLIKFHVCVVQS